MSPDSSRRSLVALLASMGTLHFVKPKPFDQIIPKWVPGSRRAWTYGSGAAELACAGLLSRPSTRRAGALLAAATFVAVFPANVQAAVDQRSKSAGTAAAWARLPLQIPLIRWALRHAR
jgi:uncharacterized membrane protein